MFMKVHEYNTFNHLLFNNVFVHMDSSKVLQRTIQNSFIKLVDNAEYFSSVIFRVIRKQHPTRFQKDTCGANDGTGDCAILSLFFAGWWWSLSQLSEFRGLPWGVLKTAGVVPEQSVQNCTTCIKGLQEASHNTTMGCCRWVLLMDFYKYVL